MKNFTIEMKFYFVTPFRSGSHPPAELHKSHNTNPLVIFDSNTLVTAKIGRGNHSQLLPLGSYLERLPGFLAPSSSSSGECGLECDLGGGPLKPLPLNGDTRPEASCGDPGLEEATKPWGLGGLVSAMMAKLDLRWLRP